MIKIECSLKTREDLRQLTPLEIKIADCLMECYYENDAFFHIDSYDQQDSLPILLYSNLIRYMASSLKKDPMPKQLLMEFYGDLSSRYYHEIMNFKDVFTKIANNYRFNTSFQFNYEVNYEYERILILGGLYASIVADTSLIIKKKRSITCLLYKYVEESPFKTDCFDPFLRIELDETPQPVLTESEKSDVLLANKPVTDEPQSNETISEEPFTNESVTEQAAEEIRFPDYIKLDNLLEQALLHYSKDEAYIQWLKALLTLTVNEQSGGDPNINNLLKAKLKLFSQKVKHLQKVEKKKHSTPNFLHLILHSEPKKLLERLHRLIDGKSGAAVGAVLLRAQQKGYLIKVPTQAEFESEFALVGKWNAIHNYMNDNNEKALAKANKIIIFEGE